LFHQFNQLVVLVVLLKLKKEFLQLELFRKP